MTITKKITIRCDKRGCSAKIAKESTSEAEVLGMALMSGWVSRINEKSRSVEHLCRGQAYACPEDCRLCSNEACNYCGAGCWQSPGTTACDHDVVHRHGEPDNRFVGLAHDHEAWRNGFADNDS
jgi:hypothetical protein